MLDPQSLSGNRLIRRADIHVGHSLTQILRARRLSPGQSLDDAPDAFFGLTTSRDGNLGFISAINERVYRRLNILQGQIINNEEQPAALNPRAYRYSSQHSLAYARLSTYEGKISNPAKGILDRDVLLQFSQLSGQRRSEYAKKSGISVARLLDDLVDIERSLSYM
jgi:cleavage and polyadenylation specificity factor subunit 1